MTSRSPHAQAPRALLRGVALLLAWVATVPLTARAQTGDTGDAAAPPSDAAVTVTADGGATPDDAAVTAAATPAEAPAATPTEAPAAAAGEASGATVRGHTLPARGASDVPITVGRLGDVPLGSAGELLRLAPGIFLANGLGDGHADQIFLRGFDARVGQDLEFTVNGVPINEPAHPHGQGHADTHFILPELVESLRVVEGPFDPHQGDFAVAGSAHYTLRLPTRGGMVRYRYGSFNAHRVVALWGPEGESPGTFGGVELASSDGFGQNRASERASGNVQYEGRSGALTWRALVTSYATRYRSAGVLRADDVAAGRADFFGTYDPTQGGESTRHMAALELESARGSSTLRAQAWFAYRTFRLRENFTGFLLDVQQPWQSPHGQRGDAIDQSAQSFDVGARASARYRATVLGQVQQAEVGFFARHSAVDATQRRLRATTDIPYRTDFDLLNAVGDLALYLDTELKPLRFVTLRGGVRADLFQYDVLDRCAVHDVGVRGAPPDAECLAADRSGYRNPTQRRTAGAFALQPRGVLLVGPWKGLTLSVAGGLGSRSADPVYLGNDQQGPFSPIAATEAGVVFDRRWDAVAVTARGLFYYTHVGQDLVFDEQQGRNSLATGTTRLGALAAARVTGAWFDLAAHATWARATFDDTGFLVPYVPDLVVRLDASATRSLPWRPRGRAVTASAALGVTYVGPRPLPLSERGDPVFTVDAQVAARWTHLELGLSAQNLLDARYQWGQFNFVSDFQGRPFPTLVAARHFTAGPPRALFVTITLHLGAAAARHGAPVENPP